MLYFALVAVANKINNPESTKLIIYGPQPPLLFPCWDINHAIGFGNLPLKA